MPGRSTAGASFASAAGCSGSQWSNVSACPAWPGGSRASEIVGVAPSSRRRLAQNAVSIMASIDSASGSTPRSSRPWPRATAMCRAKWSWTIVATCRAAGYDGSVTLGSDSGGGTLRPPGEFARFGVHLHLFTFFDEERHTQFHAGFEYRQLGDAAAAGVTPDRAFTGRHRELDVRRELHGNGVAVVLLHVHFEVVHEQEPIVGQHVVRQRQRFVVGLIHEVIAVVV